MKTLLFSNYFELAQISYKFFGAAVMQTSIAMTPLDTLALPKV